MIEKHFDSMTRVHRVISIEGKAVIVTAYVYSTFVSVDFKLFSERHSDDCFEDMAHWKSPVKAFRKIMACSKEIVMGYGRTNIVVSALDWKRIRAYSAFAKAQGAAVKLGEDPEDPVVTITVGD